MIWTRDACIAAIREWNSSTGAAPTFLLWKTAGYGHPCGNTILRLFGTFRAAIAAAGLDPRPRADQVWSRERIVAAMLDWLFKYDRWPTVEEWRNAADDHPPDSTVRYVFGSWNAARRAAGYTGPSHAKERSLGRRTRVGAAA